MSGKSRCAAIGTHLLPFTWRGCRVYVCANPLYHVYPKWAALYTIYERHVFVFFCLLTMCRALFIQYEKADILRRTPPTSSNQLILLPCVYSLEYAPPPFTRYFMKDLSVRYASYSASAFHPHVMGSSPPSSSLLPRLAVSQGELISVHSARDRDLGGHRYDLENICFFSLFSFFVLLCMY